MGISSKGSFCATVIITCCRLGLRRERDHANGRARVLLRQVRGFK